MGMHRCLQTVMTQYELNESTWPQTAFTLARSSTTVACIDQIMWPLKCTAIILSPLDYESPLWIVPQDRAELWTIPFARLSSLADSLGLEGNNWEFLNITCIDLWQSSNGLVMILAPFMLAQV